jgi:hypothetical protein
MADARRVKSQTENPDPTFALVFSVPPCLRGEKLSPMEPDFVLKFPKQKAKPRSNLIWVSSVFSVSPW